MSRTKSSTGVQATLERLTNRKPCPEYLRHTANKYLRSNQFPNNPKQPNKWSAKLESQEGQILLINALSLDEALRGATHGSPDEILAIIQGTKNKVQLAKDLEDAQQEIQRRFEVYAYWQQHFPKMRTILLDNSIDLTKQRLDEHLKEIKQDISGAPPMPFALRAIQSLETIEERGRLGRLTAKEYTEQADAYMALGDYAKAGQKAVMAIEVEPEHAQAWFIRVMALLKQRNKALHEEKRYRFLAEEIAEPMSGQESIAYELAGEQACQAAGFHDSLDKILPKALLHWPKTNQWQYSHPDQYMIVRDLFMDQIFLKAVSGGGRINSRFLHEYNGLGPEWSLQYSHDPKLAAFLDGSGQKELPFSNDESRLLVQLITERDKHPSDFFSPGDRHSLLKSFKLLHLRWILKPETGYREHWSAWSRSAKYASSDFENGILRDGTMSRLWQLHQGLNEGEHTVASELSAWQQRSDNQRAEQSIRVLLQQQTILFHRTYARHNYPGCFQIAGLGEATAGTGNLEPVRTSLPGDEHTDVPAHHPLYWRYLAALSTIKASLAGMDLTDEMQELMLAAPALLIQFKASDQWEWRISERYDEGGWDNYQASPYDTDLRDPQLWKEALELQLSRSTTPEAKARILGRLASLGST